MPEDRVWMVRLRREAMDEVAGRLALQGGDLVFTGDRGEVTRIALASVHRVRRIWGSPVLTVVHGGPAGVERTAFYFAQPPPLLRPDASRWDQRRTRRATVRYLGERNADLKPTIRAWVREIREGARAARGA
ncbi:MAG TPA: hypothetical protein VNO17_04075 [Actinomycetota bacterium]|nr:hypothetical protein [Actinomycetota bacterium]